MVEFPPYMRLVVNRTERSSGQDGPRAKREPEAPSSSQADMVSLISRENRRAVNTDIPTAMEAEAALASLQADLPGLTQGQAGDIHSGLDRRVILSLLAPLMEG